MISSLQIRLLLATLIAAVTFSPVFAGPSAPSDGKASADEGPDAAKLWAQTCSRCHNMRPAKTYSDAQWDTIIHHMRIRGNITGSDARLIAEFLKGAN